MKECDLKSYRIEKFDFVNRVNGAQKLELTHKYSYNVGYSSNNTCRGEFTAEVADKAHPESFSIVAVVTGLFSTAPGTPKEILHLQTYDMLFPYVKTVITTFTASAGIPPLYIPYIDISDKNIYRVEMPRPDRPDQ